MRTPQIVRGVLRALVLWLAGSGMALAQANSIEAVDVSQQGGKIVLRITTKSPLNALPPSFTVANPARIAFDFAGTVNALGRSSQDIAQGELRSMNLVQAPDKTRVVLNLRRPVAHEVALDGRSVVVTIAAAAAEAGDNVAHIAERRGE
ncbi:MAG: AMIN domain-containing protein [Burkholderiales bacterium]